MRSVLTKFATDVWLKWLKRSITGQALVLLIAAASLVPAQSVPKADSKPLPVAAEHPTLQILLQPLGEFPAEDLLSIKAGLEKSFYATVSVLPPIPLPGRDYKSARGRYRAANLLDYLDARSPKGSKIVGLTTADISITKGTHSDWGVFGLGDLSGSAAIVSSFRINASPALRRSRLLTVARHELGHTLGLKHCPNRRCLMAGGDNLDIEPAEFCPHCARKIAPFLK